MTFGYPLWPYVTGYVGYKLYTNDVTDVQHTAAILSSKKQGKRQRAWCPSAYKGYN